MRYRRVHSSCHRIAQPACTTKSNQVSEIDAAPRFYVKTPRETVGDFREKANTVMAAGVYTGMTGEAVALATKAANAAAETAEGRIARLFDAHHQRLYRLARRMSSTADDARDLVQEAFLRAARSPGSDRPGLRRRRPGWCASS